METFNFTTILKIISKSTFIHYSELLDSGDIIEIGNLVNKIETSDKQLNLFIKYIVDNVTDFNIDEIEQLFLKIENIYK